MKKIILAVFTIIVMVCTFSFVASALANDNPGLSPAKGYVCTKITSTTKYDNKSGSTYNASLTYDSKGHIIKRVQTTKSSDGSTYNYTITYTYDSKGHLIKLVDTSKSSDGSTDNYTITYTYDSKDNVIKSIFSKKGGYSSTHYNNNTYDSKGNLIKIVETNKNDNVTATVTYAYDSSGNIVKETKKREYGDQKHLESYKRTLTYDSKGKLTKEVVTADNYLIPGLPRVYYLTGTITTTHSYDSKGNVIKASDTVKGTRNAEKFTDNATMTYTYDSKGNCIKSVYTYIQNGSVFSTETTNYTYKKLTDVIKVKGLKASDVSTGSISLSWTKFDGAKHYKVQKYDAANKKWVTVSTVSSNSVKVQELAAGKTYKFRVTALDKNKKAVSEASAALTVSTLCKAPKTTLTSSSSKTANVTITKVTGATEYKIYKSTDGKNFKLTKTTKNLKTKLTGLSGGKKVYIKVKAVNADGKPSAYSSVKSVTVKK